MVQSGVVRAPLSGSAHGSRRSPGAREVAPGLRGPQLRRQGTRREAPDSEAVAEGRHDRPRHHWGVVAAVPVGQPGDRHGAGQRVLRPRRRSRPRGRGVAAPVRGGARRTAPDGHVTHRQRRTPPALPAAVSSGREPGQRPPRARRAGRRRADRGAIVSRTSATPTGWQRSTGPPFATAHPGGPGTCGTAGDGLGTRRCRPRSTPRTRCGPSSARHRRPARRRRERSWPRTL